MPTGHVCLHVPGEGDLSAGGGLGEEGGGLQSEELAGTVKKVGVLPNWGLEGGLWEGCGFSRLCSESSFTCRASSTILREGGEGGEGGREGGEGEEGGRGERGREGEGREKEGGRGGGRGREGEGREKEGGRGGGRGREGEGREKEGGRGEAGMEGEREGGEKEGGREGR